MTVLSVNLNKIALIRNSREGDNPDILSFAIKAVEAGAHGTLDYTIKEGVNKNKIADDKILKSKK